MRERESPARAHSLVSARGPQVPPGRGPRLTGGGVVGGVADGHTGGGLLGRGEAPGLEERGRGRNLGELGAPGRASATLNPVLRHGCFSKIICGFQKLYVVAGRTIEVLRARIPELDVGSVWIVVPSVC